MDRTIESAMPAGDTFVVLGRHHGSNSYVAVIERSFSMDCDGERACIFWSSTNASAPMLGVSGGIRVDGRKDAEHHCRGFQNSRPEIEFVVFDVRDPALPIEIDWIAWARDNEYCATTLSGVRNKFHARNARFRMRGD